MKNVEKNQKGQALIRRGVVAVLTLLVIQFIAGMVLNLYVSIPKSHPGIHGSYAPSITWALKAGGGVVLAIHVANAILLVIGSVALLIRSIISHRKTFIIGVSSGLLFTLLAFSNGLGFLNAGGKNVYSLGMALAFMSAFLSYLVTFYVTR